MAVLCREQRLLFIGNKRTGSTAVGRALESAFGAVYVPNERYVSARDEVVSRRHSTLRQLVEHRLLDIPLDELHKFTTVRNPFDSLVSQWAKLRFRANREGGWVQSRAVSFPSWIEKRFAHADPTSMHAEYVEGVDVVLRFERLAADLDDLLASRGLPSIIVARENATVERSPDHREYYDDRAREIVARVFREDLARFDYEF